MSLENNQNQMEKGEVLIFFSFRIILNVKQQAGQDNFVIRIEFPLRYEHPQNARPSEYLFSKYKSLWISYLMFLVFCHTVGLRNPIKLLNVQMLYV